MMKWLMHQEACYRFAVYLQWTVPGYEAELRAVSESKDEGDDDDDEEEEEEDPDDPEHATNIGYSIAKALAYPHVAITSIISDFGAADVLPTLEEFLCTSPHTSHSIHIPLPSTELPLYKCMTVQLPPARQVMTLVTKDIIHARPAIPAHGTTSAVPCQFDTVLAWESDDVSVDGDLQHPLDGMVHLCCAIHQSDCFHRPDCWASPSHFPAPRGVWCFWTPSCIH